VSGGFENLLKAMVNEGGEEWTVDRVVGF